jgi:hypothetical protein
MNLLTDYLGITIWFMSLAAGTMIIILIILHRKIIRVLYKGQAFCQPQTSSAARRPEWSLSSAAQLDLAQTFFCTGLCVLAFCHVNVRGPMSASCCSIQYLRESCWMVGGRLLQCWILNPNLPLPLRDFQLLIPVVCTWHSARKL